MSARNSNCPSKNNSGNENNYAINSNNKEKETGKKTEFKKSSQKNGKEKRVFTLGDSILKQVNGYEITKNWAPANYT